MFTVRDTASGSGRSRCGATRMVAISVVGSLVVSSLPWAARAATTTSTAPTTGERDRATVQAIFAQLPDAPQNQLALSRFNLAAQRFGLGPVEIVDIEGDSPPHPAEKLRAGIALVRKLDFGFGGAALDDVAAEVAASGGAGLDALALSDLFLHRAWEISRCDFNPEHVPEPTARAQAYGELIRAVMLAPGRQLNSKQFPPLLLEDWARAVADVASRVPSTLLVHASHDALVTCDGGAPIPGPATFVGLVPGEHLVHVDEPGWAAWGATLSVDTLTVELQVPMRRSLTLEDGAAAAHARRMGTRFALVGEPRPGQEGGLTMSLRLVDAAGTRRDAVIAPLAGDSGALDAAVMRLDEEARRLDRGVALAAGSAPPAASDADPALTALPPAILLAPPPARPSFSSDPGAWARANWPLLAAVGAMLGTALILSITVAADR